MMSKTHTHIQKQIWHPPLALTPLSVNIRKSPKRFAAFENGDSNFCQHLKDRFFGLLFQLRASKVFK